LQLNPPDAAPVLTDDPAQTLARIEEDSAKVAATPVLERTVGRLEIRSVARGAAAFYLSLVGVAVLASALLYFVAKNAGVMSDTERFVQILFPGLKMTLFVVERAVLILGLAGAVLVTGITVVAGYLYNLVSDVVGGVVFTVTERKPTKGP